VGQLCPLHPGQEGLPRPMLTHSGHYGPASRVSPLVPGQGRSGSLQHPEMSSPGCSGRAWSCSFASVAASPTGDGPHPSLAHLAAAGHRRALWPLQSTNSRVRASTCCCSTHFALERELCPWRGGVTKGKELRTSSDASSPAPMMSPAHGPGERGSPSPPGTARPGIQNWRQTCVQQGAKASSPILCSLPQPRQEAAHAQGCQPQGSKKNPQDHPSSTRGTGSPHPTSL